MRPNRPFQNILYLLNVYIYFKHLLYLLRMCLLRVALEKKTMILSSVAEGKLQEQIFIAHL